MTATNNSHCLVNRGSRPSYAGQFRRHGQGERGFSLLVIASGLTVMLGMLGLAFDLGRMFIVRTELQTFLDASSTAACQYLDGTLTGIQTAHTTAMSGPLGSSTPNGWNFDSTVVPQITDKYSTALNASYDSYATASGTATNSYRFVSLTASVTVPLYFLGVIPGLSTQQTMSASVVAGEQESDAVSNGGLVPFSPDAHNPADTKNFGLTPNLQYTLKWGNGNSTTCGGDAGFTPGNQPSEHGYVNLGQGDGTSNLRKAIVFGGYPNALHVPAEVDAGDTLSDVPGNRGSSIFTALAERSNQDPDQTSLTWEVYKAAKTGNARRVVTAPINDPNQASGNGSNGTVLVIGFGNFLLDPGVTISGSSGPICATYIGPASLNGFGSGGTDGTKFYAVTLYK